MNEGFFFIMFKFSIYIPSFPIYLLSTPRVSEKKTSSSIKSNATHDDDDDPRRHPYAVSEDAQSAQTSVKI